MLPSGYHLEMRREKQAGLSQEEMEAFLSRSPLEVAPELLGMHITSSKDGREVTLRITEVEAYLGSSDPASHAHRGKTPRNATMFGAPGHAYVYLSYGIHWCMNIVCWPSGRAGGVLLRAGEVISGAETIRGRGAKGAEETLALGPGRVGRALGVTRGEDGESLLGPVLYLQEGESVNAASGPRIGITKAVEEPWRFWDPSGPHMQYRARKQKP